MDQSELLSGEAVARLWLRCPSIRESMLKPSVRDNADHQRDLLDCNLTFPPDADKHKSVHCQQQLPLLQSNPVTCWTCVQSVFLKEWTRSDSNVAQPINNADKIKTVNLTCPRLAPSARPGRNTEHVQEFARLAHIHMHTHTPWITV